METDDCCNICHIQPDSETFLELLLKSQTFIIIIIIITAFV